MSNGKTFSDIIEDVYTLAKGLRTFSEIIEILADDAKVIGSMIDPTLLTTKATQAQAIAPQSKEKSVTLEQVRAVLAGKSHDGKTEAVRDLLQKYGASKLSAIDPKHYKALLSDAEEL